MYICVHSVIFIFVVDYLVGRKILFFEFFGAVQAVRFYLGSLVAVASGHV